MSGQQQPAGPLLVRDATAADFPQILGLNEASVHFLSPLTSERLELLHRNAAYHRVAVAADEPGRVAGFLLAFRESADYDSVNFRYFAARYPAFVYIDRVVVAEPWRCRGVGRLLYADLFAFALASRFPLVALEIDADPPNEVSARFHRRFGFREVGTQEVGPSKKVVSLQMAPVKPAETDAGVETSA